MARATSGQVTVTTAGTAVQANSYRGVYSYLLRALPGNSGTNIYVGNDGASDVTNANGFPLNKTGEAVRWKGALSDLYVDADTSGDKLAWLRLS
jgi:hypothetical protein